MNLTPCAECEEWCIFESMQVIGHELYCDECYEELREESE